MSHNENLFKGSIGRTYQDSQPWWPDELSAPKGAPNIVIIVLDDVGFADLGCYGSEIATPSMDRLARGGVRYSNFHVTSMCSPTRACLFTGRNAHAVGMGIIAESDLSTGTPAEIEEERRLLYVATTRAKDNLHLIVPQRFFAHSQRNNGDRHMYATRTRFIPAEILKFFECCAWPVASAADTAQMSACAPVDIRAKLRRVWNG
jgi:hypothetical protein